MLAEWDGWINEFQGWTKMALVSTEQSLMQGENVTNLKY
jgi:hypothetical protein